MRAVELTKRVGKQILPPAVVDLARWTARRNQRQARYGAIPWGQRYHEYKTDLIRKSIAEEMLLELFRSNRRLPDSYGYALDERCVEYPWMIALLPKNSEHVLDAGSTLNYDFAITHPRLAEKKVHIITLAPETSCFWRLGVSYLFTDLRHIPIRDSFYDTVVCLSTLEHVGCDNSAYSGGYGDCQGDFTIAMREMRRVLKRSGTLLFTVPFGQHQHFGSFQQFDQSLLIRAIESFGGTIEQVVSYYRYSRTGWQIASADECCDCEYVEWITRPQSEWPTTLPVERDRAAAARAVACVRLVKA